MFVQLGGSVVWYSLQIGLLSQSNGEKAFYMQTHIKGERQDQATSFATTYISGACPHNCGFMEQRRLEDELL